MIMKEVDEQDQRRRIKGKKPLKDLSPQGDGSRGTSSHRLTKGKRPVQRPSSDNNETPDEGEEFTQTLRHLVKSKPRPQTPSGDSEGSGVEGASQSLHACPVASVKALGKKPSNPVPKDKRGPYSGHEMDQVKDLANTIVEYCKNMGHTPESVLCKGASIFPFLVSHPGGMYGRCTCINRVTIPNRVRLLSFVPVIRLH